MKTSFISAYNLEALAQTNGTHEITVNTSKEFYALHDYLVFTLGWDCYEYAHVSQDGSVTINIRVNNNQPEPTNPDNTPTTMNANETTAVSVSVIDNGNKCEYAANGKTLAAITYRKEFDAYDVNTPTVGYMTANVTEAHKACESGVNWLLGHNATFDYSAVEEYNAKPYAEI